MSLIHQLHVTRRRLAVSLGAASLSLVASCVSAPTLGEIRAEADRIAAPARTQRPIDGRLEAFGEMIRAYSATDDQIAIGIDFIPNDSGVIGELPSDLGFYVESAIAGIGPTVSSHRLLPASTYVNSFGAATIQAPAAQNRNRAFVVRGCLMRATELGRIRRRTSVEGFATRGSEQGDAEITWDDEDRVTRLRVMLSLEGPDGSTLPGCTAMYDIQYMQSQDSVAWGIFVSGSGLGATRATFVSQDIGHALYDVTAACLIDVIGNALTLPYDQLGAPFEKDTSLRTRLRSQLNRLATVEAQQNAKRLMFTSGFDVDMSTPQMTFEDMKLAQNEMLVRGLNPTRDQDWVDFNMHLWDSVDYRVASERVRSLLIQNTRLLRTRLQAEEQHRRRQESAQQTGRSAI